MKEMKLAPSVFGANLGNLRKQLQILEGNDVELLHVDVMDGHFVEKMAFGPDHIKMLKDMTTIPLDVHLMIEKPERKLDEVIEAGADIITVHQESTSRLYSCIERIKAKGVKAGVVLSPATCEESLKYVLDQIDMILLMTINPGEAGPGFHMELLEKIANVRAMVGDRPIDIEVDGGIDNTNIGLCKEAGANVFVSGGYVFKGDIGEKIQTQDYRVLVVRPFLTMEDMNLIQKASFECQQRRGIQPESGRKSLMSQLDAMMKNQGVSNGLRQQIEKVIIEYEPQDEKKSAISELLKRSFIVKDETEMDWRTAMRRAAKILEDEYYIGPEYIEESIRHVEEYGDYIIIGEGIALAHAGKEYGVYKDGLSLLVSKRGIVFSDGETRVHLLFCFSSKGEKEYLELMKEIVTIGKTKKRMDKLLDMNEDQIYEELSTIKE